MDEWKILNIHTVEPYLALKRKKTLPFDNMDEHGRHNAKRKCQSQTNIL